MSALASLAAHASVRRPEWVVDQASLAVTDHPMCSPRVCVRHSQPQREDRQQHADGRTNRVGKPVVGRAGPPDRWYQCLHSLDKRGTCARGDENQSRTSGGYSGEERRRHEEHDIGRKFDAPDGRQRPRDLAPFERPPVGREHRQYHHRDRGETGEQPSGPRPVGSQPRNEWTEDEEKRQCRRRQPRMLNQ